jgi:hypothetical protein
MRVFVVCNACKNAGITSIDALAASPYNKITAFAGSSALDAANKYNLTHENKFVVVPATSFPVLLNGLNEGAFDRDALPLEAFRGGSIGIRRRPTTANGKPK